MAVNLPPPSDILSVPGVRLGVAEAAVKAPVRADVAVMALAEGAVTRAVFTQNAFSAAPVQVAKAHLQASQPAALLINSGNANAGTGSAGLEAAKVCTAAVAGGLGCPADAVLPFSTGVIGQPLPVERIASAVPQALADLNEDGWLRSAQAIMTTDTVPKAISRRAVIGRGAARQEITITGMAKGAGMIRPDMATMLAFVATDAAIEPVALDVCLQRAVDVSFNAISIDGDTSTNDACVLTATGAVGNAPLAQKDGDFKAFSETVTEVCTWLAQAIVRDGEGASHFITLAVEGARDDCEAREVAFTVAHSPLVKTAAFAGDPNWGRILAAVGRAGVDALDLNGVSIELDDVPIFVAGEPAPDYREAEGAVVMARAEYTIHIHLGRGDAAARVWTCDLSYEYVRINAEYRS